MPIVEETEYKLDSTKKLCKFATTPIMSTYLLCYVIGEYEYIERTTKNNTPVRVYTPLTKSDQGEFSLGKFYFF